MYCIGRNRRGVLEYDSPSSSDESEEESFANNNHETDDDVSGEIPSLDDEPNFLLGAFTGSEGLFDSMTEFILTAIRGS